MTNKDSYNTKSAAELNEELKKLKGTLRDLQAEKLKTGNAKNYRTTRKNIARILTALNAQSRQSIKNQ